MAPANMAGMGEDARRRLGRLIEERRVDLGLSLNQVGDMPGITRPTWTRAESGLPVQPLKYAAIERALDWSPGSVKAVLAGGEPTPIAVRVDEVDPGADQTCGGGFDLSEEIDFVSRQHDIPVEERMRMVKGLVELWREHQARQKAIQEDSRTA